MTESWRPRHEGTVRLPDGRALGYAEWGVPSGKPVLFFHGGAMSRLASIGWTAAERLGVRLLSVELPGHGLSDPRPGWRVLDWPHEGEGHAVGFTHGEEILTELAAAL